MPMRHVASVAAVKNKRNEDMHYSKRFELEGGGKVRILLFECFNILSVLFHRYINI